jgi:phosphoadenosine phosphosulfate reductase
LSKGLDFNDAYKKGLPRVGCMYCPYTNDYNEYLISKLYQQNHKKWSQFLIKFAGSVKKENPLEYVLSGAWKRRIGKSDNKNIPWIRKMPCLRNPNAMHFIMDKKINNNFIERFKPFGEIERFKDQTGNGFIVKDHQTSEGIFMVKIVKDITKLKKESKIDPNWRLGKEFLCVDILRTNNSKHLIQSIERQIRKFQECVLCGACTGICPSNAITINPHFKIYEGNCTHCKRCLQTKFLRDSCIALHANQQTRKYRDGNRL